MSLTSFLLQRTSTRVEVLGEWGSFMSVQQERHEPYEVDLPEGRKEGARKWPAGLEEPRTAVGHARLANGVARGNRVQGVRFRPTRDMTA
jgi:hypothetical protein